MLWTGQRLTWWCGKLWLLGILLSTKKMVGDCLFCLKTPHTPVWYWHTLRSGLFILSYCWCGVMVGEVLLFSSFDLRVMSLFNGPNNRKYQILTCNNGRNLWGIQHLVFSFIICCFEWLFKISQKGIFYWFMKKKPWHITCHSPFWGVVITLSRS